MKKKIKKTVMEMLLDINDVEKLERIHRFVQYIYVQNCGVRSSRYLQDVKAAEQEKSHQISSNLSNGMQKKLTNIILPHFKVKVKRQEAWSNRIKSLK